MNKFNSELKKGLSRKTHSSASVKCFPTYVQELPNGSEKGKYLALDLGGTNFRVLLVKLLDETHVEVESKIYEIPQNIMTGPGKGLFDHIADCLKDFTTNLKLDKEVLPLGFTFSFPLNQVSLNYFFRKVL